MTSKIGSSRIVPKSRKKQQAKKKEEERKRLEEEEVQEENELEFQKACLEIRVKELETLNIGLRQKCSYLETQSDVFKMQLDETREEKEDLVCNLTRKLSEQLTISKELEERLVGMQKARADDRKEFQKELVQKDTAFKKMKENMERDIQALELRLAAIDDFQVEKTTIERTVKALHQTLQNEREIYLAQFSRLETKMILYREQVKNDAVETLINLAKDVQEIGKLSLHATIKSAISNNYRLNDELEKVSESNLELRSKLEALNQNQFELNKVIRNLQTDKDISAKKCLQYKKVLELSIEKQLEISKELKSIEFIKSELKALEITHSTCKTDEEIEELITRQVELAKEMKEEEERLQIANHTRNIIEELKELQIILINTAIVTRDMIQAENAEELEFLKGSFKSMIVKIYETACNFPNLSSDIAVRLRLPFPQM